LKIRDSEKIEEKLKTNNFSYDEKLRDEFLRKAKEYKSHIYNDYINDYKRLVKNASDILNNCIVEKNTLDDKTKNNIRKLENIESTIEAVKNYLKSKKNEKGILVSKLIYGEFNEKIALKKILIDEKYINSNINEEFKIKGENNESINIGKLLEKSIEDMQEFICEEDSKNQQEELPTPSERGHFGKPDNDESDPSYERTTKHGSGSNGSKGYEGGTSSISNSDGKKGEEITLHSESIKLLILFKNRDRNEVMEIIKKLLKEKYNPISKEDLEGVIESEINQNIIDSYKLIRGSVEAKKTNLMDNISATYYNKLKQNDLQNFFREVKDRYFNDVKKIKQKQFSNFFDLYKDLKSDYNNLFSVIEKIMNVANLQKGYDILSYGEDKLKLIEVKSYMDTNLHNIFLSHNEFCRAQKSLDNDSEAYYIYILRKGYNQIIIKEIENFFDGIRDHTYECWNKKEAILLGEWDINHTVPLDKRGCIIRNKFDDCKNEQDDNGKNK